MAKLRVDFCSHQAAKHAVMRWHYSRAMPAGKLVRFGVWEDGRFVGAILYGSGATPNLSKPFGLPSTQACELVRVALASGRHHPTSKCLAVSLRLLRRQSPGLRLVVSYADTKEGHLGTIYQATNWIYLGATTQPYIKVRGRIEHPRSLHARYGKGGQAIGWLRQHVDPHAERVAMPDKLKYVWPYDPEIRRLVESRAKPYPKRVGSSDGAAPGPQPGEGGSSPTPALQNPGTRWRSAGTNSGTRPRKKAASGAASSR